MSLSLSRKMPPGLDGELPMLGALRPLCPGAHRTPSKGRPSFTSSFKEKQRLAEVGKGPGVLPPLGWSRRDQETTLGPATCPCTRDGMEAEGAVGRKWPPKFSLEHGLSILAG